MLFPSVLHSWVSARQRARFTYCWAALVLVLAVANTVRAQTASYTYTGGPQYYDVPAGVTLVQVVAAGASGGSLGSNSGGVGAQVQAVVPVVAGEQLTIILGGQGAGTTTAPNTGGTNGGGAGTGDTPLLANGGGGGGATVLRRAATSSTDDYLTSRNALLVAGGGGGSGNGSLSNVVAGGAGGTPTGGAGGGSNGGPGATQSQAGGAAINNNGSAGMSSAGGGGGGGGGYYGGGGGSSASGGGGGSSWATAAAASASYGVAAASGNGTLTITPVTPMPVQLVRFAAQRLATGAVAVSWATVSELHNSGFEVQRSANGTHWQALAFLPGAGSSAQAHRYLYTDAAAPTEVTYYRLRQVDQDGTATYSPVQAVAGGEAAALPLSLYPNPAATNALVHLIGTDPAGTVRLLDAEGRLVRELPAGSTSLSLVGLPAGPYLVRSGAATTHLVVQ